MGVQITFKRSSRSPFNGPATVWLRRQTSLNNIASVAPPTEQHSFLRPRRPGANSAICHELWTWNRRRRSRSVGPLNCAVANPKHLATLREAFMNENGPTHAKDGDEQPGRPLGSQSAMNACWRGRRAKRTISTTISRNVRALPRPNPANLNITIRVRLVLRGQWAAK